MRSFIVLIVPSEHIIPEEREEGVTIMVKEAIMNK